KTRAHAGVPCSKAGPRLSRRCVILPVSGSVVGSFVNPLPIRPCLWCSLPLFQSVFVHRGRRIRRCAMAHRLFIGGLPFSTSSDRLREVLAHAGGLESATVVSEHATGRARGPAVGDGGEMPARGRQGR